QAQIAGSTITAAPSPPPPDYPVALTRGATSSRVVTLQDPNDVLSLASLTETMSLNSKTFSRTFNAATKTWTITSPQGLQTKEVLDGKGRRAELWLPGQSPVV